MKNHNINKKVFEIVEAIKDNKNKVYQVISNSRNTVGIRAIRNSQNKISVNPEMVMSETSKYWERTFKGKDRTGKPYWMLNKENNNKEFFNFA